MSANITENIEGKKMVLLRNNKAWWGGSEYKVEGSFLAKDEVGRLMPGVSPDKFFVARHPTFKFDGKKVKYEGCKIVFRADNKTPISHIGSRSAIIQPSEFAEMADKVTKEVDARAATFVFTDKGQEMSMTIMLDENKYSQKFLSLGCSNDNNQTLWLSRWNNEIVCQNTRRAAFSQVLCKIKMTLGYEGRINRMVSAVEGFKKYDKWFEEFEAALGEISLDKKERVEFIKEALPHTKDKDGNVLEGRGKSIVDNKRMNLNYFIRMGTGNRNNTMSDLYSGVTEFQSHPERSKFGSTKATKEESFLRQVKNDNPLKDKDYERKAIDFIYARHEDSLPKLILN